MLAEGGSQSDENVDEEEDSDEDGADDKGKAISLNAAVRSSVSRYQSNQGGASGRQSSSAETLCTRVGNEYPELESSETCTPRTSL
ncbi:hypothetical protein Q7P35_002218 [Cladosporium inversicolor]